MYNSSEYENNDEAVYYFVPNARDKLNLMEYVLYFLPLLKMIYSHELNLCF